MQIVKYNLDYKSEWDSFVRNSKNGTFLFCRDFMDYHSDRFQDYSLLFFEKNNLIAILPANKKENEIHSHQGLTYGGLLASDQIKSAQVLAIFEKLVEYLRAEDINKFTYKPTPHIYHTQPSEEDLYALFRQSAVLISRSIASSIDMSNRISYAQLRKRQVKKAEQQGVVIREMMSFVDFWAILEQNLMERHGTQPVHSLDEIMTLKNKFVSEIRLFCSLKDDEVTAGCLVFETENVAHIQYISASEEGKRSGALDFLFDKLINEVFAHKKYFDFGISTEEGGLVLNEGLISQKEGFGARGIVYDTYQINI